MSKKKRTGSNPLEDMFPQIQDTREQNEEVKEIKEDIKANSEDSSKSDPEADEEKKQNNQEEAQESSPASPASDTDSNEASVITIPKKVKTTEYVRMTHYFRPDQLKELDKLHKQSGRDKSELVRLAVDILIEQAKIE